LTELLLNGWWVLIVRVDEDVLVLISLAVKFRVRLFVLCDMLRGQRGMSLFVRQL